MTMMTGHRRPFNSGESEIAPAASWMTTPMATWPVGQTFLSYTEWPLAFNHSAKLG